MFGMAYKTDFSLNISSRNHFPLWIQNDSSEIPADRNGYKKNNEQDLKSKFKDSSDITLDQNKLSKIDANEKKCDVFRHVHQISSDLTEEAYRRLHSDSGLPRSSPNDFTARDSSICWMVSNSRQLYLSLQKSSRDCSSPKKEHPSDTEDEKDRSNDSTKISQESASFSTPSSKDEANDERSYCDSNKRSRTSPVKENTSSRKNLKFGIDKILKNDSDQHSSMCSPEKNRYSDNHSSTISQSKSEERTSHQPYLQPTGLDDRAQGTQNMPQSAGLLPPRSQFLSPLFQTSALRSHLLPVSPLPPNPALPSPVPPLPYLPAAFMLHNLSSSTLRRPPSLTGPLGLKPPYLPGEAMEHREAHRPLPLPYSSRLGAVHPHKDLLQIRSRDFSSSGGMQYPGMGSSMHRDLSSSPPGLHGSSKKKRSWSRAVFSNLQRKGLEKRFDVQKYVTKPDRRQLAAMLGLTDAQVKVWFQNRRMKWRHQEEAAKKKKEEDQKRQHQQTKQQVTSSEDCPDSCNRSADWSGSQEYSLSLSNHSEEEKIEVDSYSSDEMEIHPDSDIESDDLERSRENIEIKQSRLNGSLLEDKDVRSRLRFDEGGRIQGPLDILDLRLWTL